MSRRRWSPPDKPRDRPTVPEVLEVLREYRTLPRRSTGGAVHILVDDPNFEQHLADSCAAGARAWAEEWGGGFHPLDQRLADMLAAMTPTQRRRVYAADTYPPSSA